MYPDLSCHASFFGTAVVQLFRIYRHMPQTICLFKDYQQEPNILQFEESFHLRWVLLHLRGHPIRSTLFHLYYCWNVVSTWYSSGLSECKNDAFQSFEEKITNFCEHSEPSLVIVFCFIVVPRVCEVLKFSHLSLGAYGACQELYARHEGNHCKS